MADRYRVRIDLGRIQSNLLAYEGGRLSELQVRSWLLSVGFTPEPDGRTWLAERDCRARLYRTEIVELTRAGPAAWCPAGRRAKSSRHARSGPPGSHPPPLLVVCEPT
jgi:hypothetical protein